MEYKTIKTAINDADYDVVTFDKGQHGDLVLTGEFEDGGQIFTIEISKLDSKNDGVAGWVRLRGVARYIGAGVNKIRLSQIKNLTLYIKK